MTNNGTYKVYVSDLSRRGDFALGVSSDPNIKKTVFIPARTLTNLRPRPIFDLGHLLECELEYSTGEPVVSKIHEYDQKLLGAKALEEANLPYHDLTVARINDDLEILFAMKGDEEVFVPKRVFLYKNDFDDLRPRDTIRAVITECRNREKERHPDRKWNATLAYDPNVEDD